MARMRLGVVLLVPAPWRNEIDGLRRALGDTALGRIDPHITLVPPINVREADLPVVLALVRAAAAGVPPLDLRLGPVTTFDGASPVAYLAVGGEPDQVEALHRLRAAVRSGPLHRADEHDYVPHVTVAAELPPDRLAAALAALSETDVGVRIDAVHVLREEPGHVWVPIADAPLGGAGGGVVGRGSLPLEIVESELADAAALALLDAAGGAAEGFVVTGRSGSVPPRTTVAPDIDEDTAGGAGAAAAVAATCGSVTGAAASTSRPAVEAAAAGSAPPDPGRVVAVARGFTVGKHLELSDLVVAEGHRRLGIGRHLVRAVEALGVRRGCATASAALDTAGVGALLASCGWEPEGARWRRRLQDPTG